MSDRMIPVARVLELFDERLEELSYGLDETDQARSDALAQLRDDVAALANPTAPTERPHVTPIGGNLAVKPLGSPDPQPAKPARKSPPRLKYKFGPAGSIHEIALTAGQRETLRTVHRLGLRHRDNICPRRLLTGSSSASLVKKGLLAQRSFPVIGYKLTAEGKAVVAALTKDD